jgi:hypothetical protein
MKKGLLLSIVASTVLFAGGDIAPVEPVAEAPAAACNDFYGHVAAGVIANISTTDDNKTNTSVQYGVAAVLGVNKEIFSGVTLNAEVQGATLETYTKAGDANGTRSGFAEQGGLTQFNLGYSFANTAIKVGRFAVPKNLSPLSYTDTNYFGLKDHTYEGVLVANTDLADTTVWGAYLHNTVSFGAGAATRARLGVIAAGLVNKSFADTTITAAGYYDLNGTGNQAFTWMAAASVDHSFGDTAVSLGGSYTAWDNKDVNGSYLIGAYVKQSFDMFDATLAATYQNDGQAGYSKYTDITNPVAGNKAWGLGLKLGADVVGGKLSLGASYSKNDDNNSKAVATVGYSKTVRGIALGVDYKYTKMKDMDPTHRVRAKAVYKF